MDNHEHEVEEKKPLFSRKTKRTACIVAGVATVVTVFKLWGLIDKERGLAKAKTVEAEKSAFMKNELGVNAWYLNEQRWYGNKNVTTL